MKKSLYLCFSLLSLGIFACSQTYECDGVDMTEIVRYARDSRYFFGFDGWANVYPNLPTVGATLEGYRFPEYNGVNYSRLCYKVDGSTTDIYRIKVSNNSYVLNNSSVFEKIMEVPTTTNPIHIYDDMPLAAIDTGNKYALFTTTGTNLGVEIANLDDVSCSFSDDLVYAHVINRKNPGFENDIFLSNSSDYENGGGFSNLYLLKKTSSSSTHWPEAVVTDDYLLYRFSSAIKYDGYVYCKDGQISYYPSAGSSADKYDILSEDCFSKEMLACERLHYLVLPSEAALSVLLTGYDAERSIQRTELFVLKDNGKTSTTPFAPIYFEAGATVDYHYGKVPDFFRSTQAISSSSFPGYKLNGQGEVGKTKEVTFTVSEDGKIGYLEDSQDSNSELAIDDIDNFYAIEPDQDDAMLGVDEDSGKAMLFYFERLKGHLLKSPTLIYQSAVIDDFDEIVINSSSNFAFKTKDGKYRYCSGDASDLLENKYLGVTRFSTNGSNRLRNIARAVENAVGDFYVEGYENYTFRGEFIEAFNICSLMIDNDNKVYTFATLANKKKPLQLPTDHGAVRKLEFLTRLNVGWFQFKVTYLDGTSDYLSVHP